MSRFVLHPEAYNDLDEIWEYIAEDNQNAADRLIEEIFEKIGAASMQPNLGHRRRDLTSRTLRFHVVHDYLIAYAPDEKPIVVIAVLHGRRNPYLIAAVLNERY